MSVKSDQSANEALLAPAKPTKTSRGNNIFCTAGIIPLKLPRKSNVRTVWVLHWKDSLEENIQRVKHKWRTTQHFIKQVQEWNPHWFSPLSKYLQVIINWLWYKPKEPSVFFFIKKSKLKKCKTVQKSINSRTFFITIWKDKQIKVYAPCSFTIPQLSHSRAGISQTHQDTRNPFPGEGSGYSHANWNVCNPLDLLFCGPHSQGTKTEHCSNHIDITTIKPHHWIHRLWDLSTICSYPCLLYLVVFLYLYRKEPKELHPPFCCN